ncbi:MAG TPA: hypothetical protein PLP29_03360 [Candidatus Ozemobacteraceae bacterium]|nr:hypothetical protein [Candidatus Ozemobacteraceae bacterium]
MIPFQSSESEIKHLSWLPVITAFFLLWGLAFIFRTTFLIGDVRYTCLFDDAMISMTYARNLVDGYGLNWARWGDPVEGFTHPLWLGFMLIPNALGIPIPLRSLFIQLLSLGILAANLWALESFMRRHWPDLRLASFVAVTATAAYYPLNHWALQGMETGFQSLLLLLGLRYALDGGSKSFLKLALVGTTATLLRMDMWIPTIILLGAFWSTSGLSDRRTLLVGIGILVLPNLAYLVFRWGYFHDILPNTYYLKMTGGNLEIRILRGLDVFIEFARPLWLLLFSAAFTAAAFWNSLPQVRWLSLLLFAQFEYAVWVGGDAWEQSSIGANRFTSFVMPLVFLLASLGLDRTGIVPHRKRFAILCSLLLICISNGFLETGWKDHFENFTLRTCPHNVGAHQTILRDTLVLNAAISKTTRVAVTWAGIPAFFSDYQLIDIFGYNDRFLAKSREARETRFENPSMFQPGHMKFSLHHTFDDLAPDVIYFSGYLSSEFEAQELISRGFRKDGIYWLRSGFIPQRPLSPTSP